MSTDNFIKKAKPIYIRYVSMLCVIFSDHEKCKRAWRDKKYINL